jgi:anti-anti-sigma factor
MTQTTDHLRDSAPGDSWLRVEMRTSARSCTLLISGALCGNSIAALDAQVDQLGATPCEMVVVDLQHLSSIDDRGARVLAGLRHYVEARGGIYRIVGACSQVQRVILKFDHDFGSSR